MTSGVAERMAARMRWLGWPLLAVPAGLLGCAAGSPLLHPAHPLPKGTVSLGAGTSASFLGGDGRRAIDRAAAAGTTDELARGAAALALMSPGLSPWVGTRIGVAPGTDAGLTYTGRAARLDARYAPLVDQTAAISVGLGATGLLPKPGSSPPGAAVSASGPIAGVDTRYLAGWGIDLPVIAGWRSSGEVVQIWGGARGSLERIRGDLAVDFASNPGQKAPFEGYRWTAGGLVGLAVGVKPIWAALELDGAYQYAEAKLDLEEGGTTTPVTVTHRAKLDGWVFTPAAALLARF
jgi:hypothetical protein